MPFPAEEAVVVLVARVVRGGADLVVLETVVMEVVAEDLVGLVVLEAIVDVVDPPRASSPIASTQKDLPAGRMPHGAEREGF